MPGPSAPTPSSSPFSAPDGPAPAEAAADAVRDLHERLLRAWNARDAAGYAALFEPDAALVGFDGSQVRGDRLRKHLEPIFADHATAAYVWLVTGVTQLADGVMLLRADVGMVPPGKGELNPEANAVQSLVARRGPRAGEWRVVLFQNTPAQYHGRPELAEQHTEKLNRVLHAAEAAEPPTGQDGPQGRHGQDGPAGRG